MKKMGNIGIVIFSIIGILLSLYFLTKFNVLNVIIALGFSFLYVNLLRLKNWARLWLIILNAIPLTISVAINFLFLFTLSWSKISALWKNAYPENASLALIITVIVHIYFLGFIYFFTRNNVKKCFDSNVDSFNNRPESLRQNVITESEKAPQKHIKNPIEVILISWLIILSEAIFLLNTWFKIFPIGIVKFIASISIGGGTFLRLILNIPVLIDTPLHSATARDVIGYYINPFLSILLIICGLGMLKLKNAARIGIFIFSGVNIFIICGGIVWLIISKGIENIFTILLTNFFLNFKLLLFISAYVFFLSSPKINKCFKDKRTQKITGAASVSS